MSLGPQTTDECFYHFEDPAFPIPSSVPPILPQSKQKGFWWLFFFLNIFFYLKTFNQTLTNQRVLLVRHLHSKYICKYF